MVGQSGGFTGRTGRVQNRPTTQEALEGKGVLDRKLVDGDLDLVIQAQLTAAINRHVINVTTTNPGQQNWYDASKFYQANPTNHYSKFWHLPGISVDNLSYGFAYDDVADQSPSLHTSLPTKVVATFGGYASSTPTIPATTDIVTAYNDCNYSGFSGGLTIGDYNLARLKSLGLQEDAISSLRVAKGFQAILFQDDNFSGASTIITVDNSCFDAIWNDKVSSIRILANGATDLGNTTYYLQNRNSGLNMEVTGLSTANNANIAQGRPTTADNQKFIFTHLGDGLYKIIAKNSGLSLDVKEFNKANGANIEQYTYAGTSNQQFVLVSTGDGYYKIVARHSGKLIEVSAFSTANNANIQQWENVDQLSGQWKLVSASQAIPTLIQAEDYSLMSGIKTETTTDTGGGLNVAYTDTGDWLAYKNISFPTTGSYLIEYRVASAVNGAKISADLNAGSIVLGALDVPNTGAWQNWQTIAHTVNVNAGVYNFGLFIQNSGVNINWIKITKTDNTAKVSVDSASKTQTTEDNTALTIYPNPVESTLLFSKDITGTSINVVDTQGNLISQQKTSTNSLDVSQLKAGIYFIVLEKEGVKTVKRFIKK